MGRPAGRVHDVQISFKIPGELLRRLKKASLVDDRPMSSMLRKMVEEGLDRRKPPAARPAGPSRKR